MKKDELSTLFPGRGVDLPDGTKVMVTPLTLEDLPKISEAFGVVLSHAEKGAGNADIASRAAAEIAKLIPYCIDRPASEIPLTHAPEVIDAVIEQNVTDEVLGKWKSLVLKITDLQKEVGENETKE